MKRFKRILASLLVLCMMAGLVPANAMPVEAANDTTDYLFLATDRHTNTSVIGNIINNMEKTIGENELDYLGLGGDMVGSGNSHPSYNSSTVLNEVKGATSSLSATNVDIVAGIHDMNVNDDSGIVLPYQGGGAKIYEGDKFYVYGVEEYCISDDSDESNWSSEAQKFVTWANGSTIDKSKVIIVLSHYPLHTERDDNDGAYYWHKALNTVATGSETGTEVVRNVAFFHGHNHTVDSNEYVYNVGDTMSIQNGSSKVSDTIRYTYATAGYLNQNSKATLMTITDEAITLQKYSTSGNATAMTSVARVSTGTEEVTLESISVSGKTEYTIGDKLAITVTANYSNGTTKDVTSEATISTVDMATAGTKTVTVTYEEKTTTLNITVAESDAGDEEDPDVPVDGILPDPTTATVTGATTTEKKDVYVLVSTPTAGNQYIIASSGSAGNAYALKENTTTGSSISINAASGNITAPYIETTDETIMWNAESGMTFQSENDGYYVYYNSGLNFYKDYSMNWSVGTNSMYYYNQYSPNNKYRYLYNDDGIWTTKGSKNASSNYNVYFYEKQTVNVETSANGTYSIVGKPVEVSKVVVEGTTTTLGSTLKFVPESGTTTTTDTSTTATYTVYKDEAGIISGISGNTVTFTGNTGTAYVKVSYTVTVDGKAYPVDNYILVEAKEPTYTVDITKDEKIVEETLAVKGVTNGQPLQLGQTVTYETATGIETITPAEGTIEWEIPEEQQQYATVDSTGLVTFKGVTGTFTVTVSYTVSEGHSVTDTITVSANTSAYTTPSDGTVDFPEYPNEGAIRYDKTATAVGNFSETGIAKVELSMTGVPFTTNNAMDVVVMLDMTGSMSDDGMEAAEEATKAFVETIVKNEDGFYNSNRIAVYAFNSGSSSPYELVSLKSISSDSELETANTAIDTASDKQASGGTPFDEAAEKCYNVLAAAKTDGIGNDRQQFCVFMSDGGPTAYRATYNNTDGYLDISNSGSGTSAITTYLSGYSSSTSSSWNFTLPSEYYTDLMKADGVTVYTVGLLLQNKPSNPSPYSSMTSSTYDSTTDSLTTVGSHYYFTSRILKQMATDESKYIDIFDVDNADNATAKFQAIAEEILEAAKNVVVQDKIADDYTMVFDFPTGDRAITGLDNQEFYIEVLNYTLDDNHERVGNGTSLVKLYLGTENGKYYAASDANGTKFADPVFTAVADGEKGYYSIVDASYEAEKDEIVLNVNGTYYKFIADGSGDYNMTSGAYAYGTVDETTNMSTDLVLVTPYFCYSAATRMLAWTAEKLTTTELALSYFLYLDDSATEVGTADETPAGTYVTNDYATITYTNYRGNECQQKFPVPQMTWNGAQVSYIFYLVNSAGQPINKAGQVVDFANATFITETYTEAVVWNKGEDGQVDGESNLSIDWLANELLPGDYKVYDEDASYELKVYADSTGASIFNYFTIEGGTAAEISTSLNNRLTNLNTTSDTVSVETTKVYNTKAGVKYDDYGTYTSKDAIDRTDEIILENFDFANTTVAFAVVWQPTLVPDTVVVDYGLPVVINAVQNDLLQNTISGIGLSNEAYGNIAMNNGVSTTSKLGTASLTTGQGSTISIENENAIRYTQKDMNFNDVDVFYYESPVEFYEGSEKEEGYMYSSVTVVPATNIYFEDTTTFVTYKDSTTGTYGKWSVAGTENTTATQAQDRPGVSQISAELDADNIYGYDEAYAQDTQYSLGSAHKVTVSSAESSSWPTASFTFTGNAFDIISQTSNTTGTITVSVVGQDVSYNKMWIVDTFYGYTFTQDTENPYVKYTYTYGDDAKWHVTDTEEVATNVAAEGENTEVPAVPQAGDVFVAFEENRTWVTTTDTDNTLYQIPVIKSPELAYGTYTVTITPRYAEGFNHTENTYYDFYLDGIRVYNPAENSDAANAVYEQDGEAYPEYIELRTALLDQNAFDTTTDSVAGAVFIDGFGTSGDISDYANVGPNNEIYLKKGQSVAFALSNEYYATTFAQAHLGVKAPNGGSASVTVAAIEGTALLAEKALKTESTAELYYDVTDCVKWNENGTSKVIVITNENEPLVSITNLKIAYKPTGEEGTATTLAISNEEALGAVSFMSARYLASAPVAEPTVFVPETFEVSLNKESMKVGSTVTVTVKTSDDVANVTVNGNDALQKSVDETTGSATWSYTLKATATGELQIDTIAYNADGLASDTISNTVTVTQSVVAQAIGQIINWLSGLFGR